jgi:AcrR family transcriptional regulator
MSYRRTEAIISRLDDNRSRILEAARNLVAEGGWQGAHIAAVAQKAGFATGTVYRYFPSKAELYAEVLSQVSSRECDVIAAIVDSGGSATARLEGAVRAFASRALRGRRLAYALIGEPCDPEINQARLRWRAALSEEFVRLIEDGQREGTFRACNPRVAGACVAGALMEALAGPLAPDSIDDRAAIAHLIEEIVRNCVALIEAAPPDGPQRSARGVR